MKPGEQLLICGASARAAVESALAAGITPFAIDLFNDVDLLALCEAVRIPSQDYPRKLPEYVGTHAPPGPWMYTGGLENHPELVDAISRQHPLWGCAGDDVRHVRDPFALHALLRACGLPAPECRPFYQGAPSDGTWLAKPLAGAGGAGIQPWKGPPLPRRSGRGAYFQKRIPGQSYSAVFLGDGHDALLLGISQQLVGEAVLHAKPFAYCGSIGPVDIGLEVERRLGDAAALLTQGTGLRGLFGLDFVLHDGLPWIVELNPRYTASVEVLERATGKQFLALVEGHFENGLTCRQFASRITRRTADTRVAKGILFAARDLTFDPDAAGIMEMDVRDVSPPGTLIRKGQPIVSVFADGDTVELARARLWEHVADLDRRIAES